MGGGLDTTVFVTPRSSTSVVLTGVSLHGCACKAECRWRQERARALPSAMHTPSRSRLAVCTQSFGSVAVPPSHKAGEALIGATAPS